MTNEVLSGLKAVLKLVFQAHTAAAAGTDTPTTPTDFKGIVSQLLEEVVVDLENIAAAKIEGSSS